MEHLQSHHQKLKNLNDELLRSTLKLVRKMVLLLQRKGTFHCVLLICADFGSHKICDERAGKL